MDKPEEHIYEVELNWNEGRLGTLSSSILDSEIEVATPPEFPGGLEGIWSPEHLFVASVSSCFMTSFTAIAEFSKFDFESLIVKTSGILSKKDGKFVMSKIHLNPVLTINNEKDEKKGYRLLEKAEQICLISRSIKSEIVLEPDVMIALGIE
ncbi:MAG: OsmC family protein [Balneolales bacterium]